MKPPADRQLILDSLIIIAREAGRAPSRSEFLTLSGISEHQVMQFFPSWNDAVRAAGLLPHTLNVRLKDRELLKDWAFAVRRNGKVPARRAYRHLGQYDPRTFQRHFGSWSKLPEVFREFAEGKPEWADVLALLPAPKPAPKRPPDPVPKPASEEGRGPDHKPPSLPPSKAGGSRGAQHPPLKDRPTYGRTIDFRGLRHEPVNEQGVVLLFGLVAKELGYIVESVQSGFPDCEAKRQTGPRRWQRVLIEFEFESRNFRDHGHSLTGCDVIVCWRHNWEDCPPQIEVLELCSVIESLPNSRD